MSPLNLHTEARREKGGYKKKKRKICIFPISFFQQQILYWYWEYEEHCGDTDSFAWYEQILDTEPQSSLRPLLCHFLLFSFLLPMFPKNTVIVLRDRYILVLQGTECSGSNSALCCVKTHSTRFIPFSSFIPASRINLKEFLLKKIELA